MTGPAVPEVHSCHEPVNSATWGYPSSQSVNAVTAERVPVEQ
ncbi:MAG: hypothetical protein QM589_10950 [Thermomicrobiales bacterium]